MNEFEEKANKMIDLVCDYIVEHYEISYKDKKTPKDIDNESPEEDRALIYGVDYYNMEDEIAQIIKKELKQHDKN